MIRTRDRRIDTLRGLMLVIMTIDHFGGYLSRYTWQPLGFVSAAEGFVFLSGYVCYLAYCKPDRPLWVNARRSLNRAFVVYSHHLGLFLLVILIPTILPQYLEIWNDVLDPVLSSPFLSTLCTALLLHQPHHMDILPMYTIFLFLLPLIPWALSRVTAEYLLLLSFLLWLTGQFFNPVAWIDHHFIPGLRPGYFNILAWQFIFFLGIYVSHRSAKLFTLLENRRVKYLLLSLFFSFFLARHLHIGTDFFNSFYRGNLPYPRVINFLLVAAAIHYLIKGLPKQSFVIFLEDIGRQSLQYFTCHILCLYMLKYYISQVQALYGPFWQALLVLSIVLFQAAPLVTLPEKYTSFILPFQVENNRK